MDRYAEYIYKEAADTQFPPITGSDIKEVCASAAESAAGLDVWAPADFKHLSDTAYERLAELFEMIEDQGRWPEAALHARAAYMEKDEDDAHNPLAYRVLLIMPTIYRKWATVRLQQLQSWIDRWALEEMYAGTKGQGAADGSYHTALQIELCKLYGIPYKGGAADIYKCFDQIPRELG